MADETTLNTGDTTVPINGQDPNKNAPVAPLVPPTAPPPGQAKQIKDPTPEEIGAALSTGGTTAAPIAPNAPQAAQPVPFDLSQLRPEQLQALKGMLAATPERAAMKTQNPTVTLRRYTTINTEGQETSKLIVDFKRAYETMVRDDQANSNKEVVMIPVLFLGEQTFVNILYKDFINSDQVPCEVISSRSIPGRIVEGMVLQRETGRMIEREVKTLDTYFTLQLPVGTVPATIEIQGRIANG